MQVRSLHMLPSHVQTSAVSIIESFRALNTGSSPGYLTFSCATVSAVMLHPFGKPNSGKLQSKRKESLAGDPSKNCQQKSAFTQRFHGLKVLSADNDSEI